MTLCKVPPEPEAPAGTPGSARTFRAARNFYKLSLLKWGLAQVAAVAAGVFWLSIDVGGHIGQVNPARVWIGGLFHVLELIGLLALLLQMPFTYFLVRLDYEMRWYIITDRSLRIRYGVINVREMTMTYANIQQMTIRQGPVQRLLGISDLQVRTAGGGGGAAAEVGSHHGGAGESMHLGYFRGVDHAEAIRDLIVERLRQYRDTGLGDPDDTTHNRRPASSPEGGMVEVARELLAESRALRKALGASG